MITYKYRAYLSKAQKELFDKMLWEAKNLYNFYLESWENNYKIKGKGLSKFKLEPFRKQFKDQVKHLPSQVQQNVAGRLDFAFKRFFSKQNGLPKFKSLRQVRSVTYNNYKHGFNFDSKRLKLTNLGKIKIKFDRPISGTPKTCTLKKFPSGKYYVFIAVDNSKVPSTFSPDPSRSGKVVGIDPGISKFLTISDRNYIKKPEFLSKRFQLLLSRAQRELSRKKKGSKNREKARIHLAKIYERIANKRRDHHFKVAHYLVNHYETIFIEKLQTSFMITKNSRKSKGLAKHAIDVALYEFLSILHYMSNKYQSKIIDVDPQMTSKICSSCGATVQKDLSIRTHSCPVCGLSIDRDLNAALNILNRGLGVRGTVGSTETITLVETNVPGVD